MNLTPIKRKVGKYRGIGSNCYCYCMETDDLGALGFDVRDFPPARTLICPQYEAESRRYWRRLYGRRVR
jgi:hypothetical protein